MDVGERLVVKGLVGLKWGLGMQVAGTKEEEGVGRREEMRDVGRDKEGKGAAETQRLTCSQMGRRATGYVHWRQAEVDNPTGARVWGSGYGTDSCGVYAE